MDKATDYIIYETYDYFQFKILEGNRDVKEKRVSAIIDSIREIGYQPVPILVNEKLEIVDGQGRHDACEALGLPIYYMVKKGIGIKECVAMNIKMKNWDIYDFIQSYSAQKNDNYLKLQEYCKNTNELNIVEVALCLSDAYSRNIDRPSREGYYKIIDDKDNLECLEFMRKTKPKINVLKGGSNYYFPVLVGLFKARMIDDVRMLHAIETHIGTMKGAYSTDTAITELQNVYNYHQRKTEYFRDRYLQMMESKGATYGI